MTPRRRRELDRAVGLLTILSAPPSRGLGDEAFRDGQRVLAECCGDRRCPGGRLCDRRCDVQSVPCVDAGYGHRFGVHREPGVGYVWHRTRPRTTTIRVAR